MQYSEQAVDIGTLETSKRIITTVPIPGQFGTGVSLVASLSVVPDSMNEGGILWWWLATSVNGDDWIALPTNEDSGVRATDGEVTDVRIHGPFGDHLAVQFVTRLSKDMNDHYSIYARWDKVVLSLGVQFG